MWVLSWIGGGRDAEGFKDWFDAQSRSAQSWMDTASPEALASVTIHRKTRLTVGMISWCAAGLVVFLCSRFVRRRRRGAAAGIVCAWMVGEVLLFGAGTWAGRPRFPGVVAEPTPIIEYMREHLGSERYFNATAYMPLWENRGAVYGLANTYSYVGSKLNISWEHDVLFGAAGRRLATLNLFATRYVLLGEDQDPGPLQPVFGDEGIALCQNPYRLPLVTFVNRAEVVSDPLAAVEIIKSEAFDPLETLLLQAKLPADRASSSELTRPGKCDLVRWAAGDIAIDVETERARWLLISASYDKGWRATMDDTPLAIHRANVCFMALHVPEGRHEVTLRYATPGLKLGGLVSGTSAILLVVFMIVSHRRATPPTE